MIAIFLPLALQADTLSDAALIAYAAAPWDRAEKMDTHEVLGIHHGASVVADFPCSDLCPDYTVRVIHYEFADGQSCASVEGVQQRIRIPDGIGSSNRYFCVPAPLAGQGGFVGD